MTIGSSLRALRTRAPAHLLPAVLARIGVGDQYITCDTPAGKVYVAFNAHGVAACDRVRSDVEFERRFTTRFGRPIVRVAAAPTRLGAMIQRALSSGRLGKLPVDLRGCSELQRAVLMKAAAIAPGEVRTYAWIAREIGRPKAVRAVGTALARNPVPVLIPCHRVVRTDGHLGGYIWGLPRKIALLRAEGVDARALEARAARGKRLLASETTKIVCFPTCPHARRITPRHQRWFSSAAEAARAGYRPCARCRPGTSAA